MKIATLGPKGTFADVATRTYIKKNNFDAEIVYINFFNDVVSQVSNGKADMAIIPIENSLDGYVQKTLDLLGVENAIIIDEITLPINFKFVTSAPSLKEVESIYCQFKANGQCSKFIEANKDKKILETDSNMLSYENWQKVKGNHGAIIPEHIEAEDASLVIDNIADSTTNFTRFVVLVNYPIENVPYKKKATLMVSHDTDQPGLLFNILQCFLVYELNLTSIISRPSKVEIGAHNFFIDVESSDDDFDAMAKCIEKLKKKYKVKVLGIY